jgi:transcriptional regulator with XRE-family HTH domain
MSAIVNDTIKACREDGNPPSSQGNTKSKGGSIVITAPPARRRLVGGALRRYRENLGYTLDDAAQFLQCDRSKMSRIETGQRGIRPKELRDLLTEYGIGEQQQAILAVMTDSRGGHGWYQAYADVLPGAWRDYVALEATASRVLCYEAQRVPALLQTPAYARALADADPGLAGSGVRDKAVEATLARQKAILAERKTDVHVVIGEAALHQRVGGAAVIEGQLRVLAGFAGDSGMITVQILPFDSGAHAATGVGSLSMLQFAEAPALGLVHLGGVGGGVCLEAQEDIAAYARVFEQVKALALTPAQSALLLRGLADR